MVFVHTDKGETRNKPPARPSVRSLDRSFLEGNQPVAVVGGSRWHADVVVFGPPWPTYQVLLPERDISHGAYSRPFSSRGLDELRHSLHCFLAKRTGIRSMQSGAGGARSGSGSGVSLIHEGAFICRPSHITTPRKWKLTVPVLSMFSFPLVAASEAPTYPGNFDANGRLVTDG